MIRVRAPSRLHFGLFALASPEGATHLWPDREGRLTLPARHFGGVGLMIERPGLVLTVETAPAWSADGPSAARALAFAHRAAQVLRLVQPYHVCVERCPPEHVGLGSGTQLGLAVARALAEASGHTSRGAVELALLVGRGQRSGLGVHGFAQGGFLVEGGKTGQVGIAPLLCRHTFPEEWRIVLILPAGVRGTHGVGETEAFAQLPRPRLTHIEAQCRLVLLGLLPALIERDFKVFGEALYDFNRRSGELFAPWQGGLYAHPRIEEIVRSLREAGVHGVGQSSWGPVVFALAESTDQAQSLCNRLRSRLSVRDEELHITAAAATGAVIADADA